MYSFYFIIHHCYKEGCQCQYQILNLRIAEWWPSYTRDLSWPDLRFERSWGVDSLILTAFWWICTFQGKCICCSINAPIQLIIEWLGDGSASEKGRKLLRSHRLRVTGTVGPSVGKHFGSSPHSVYFCLPCQMGTHSSDECIHSLDVLFWRVWTMDRVLYSMTSGHCLGFDWKRAVCPGQRERDWECKTYAAHNNYFWQT